MGGESAVNGMFSGIGADRFWRECVMLNGQLSFWGRAGWWAFNLVTTTAAAAGIAFYVSDYVVRANTAGTTQAIEATLQSSSNTSAGLQTALQALQSSIDRLGDQIGEMNGAVGGLRQDSTFLTASSKENAEAIARVEAEVAKIKLAVQTAGISIGVKEGLADLFAPGNESWDTVRAKFGVAQSEPLFIQIPPNRD